MQCKTCISSILLVSAILLSMLLMSVPSVVAETVSCDNCSDCTTKIQNATPGDIIRLTSNISDCNCTCITFDQPGEVTFDGMGYTISGIGERGMHGILLPAYTDNCTIQNVTLTRFDDGMYIYDASYNLIQNVFAHDNDDCGIDLIYGTGNVIRDCVLPENGYYDFYFRPHPTDDCNMSVVNVTGTKGLPIGYYTENVSLSDLEFAVLYLCGADGSTLSNITITGSDTYYNNGMKVYGTDNALLSDITSSDNFCGLSIEESSNNIIRNVVCDDCWHYNIYMRYGSGNLLENVTVSNSHQAGIYLNGAHNNILTRFVADCNPFGIKLDRSTHVVVNDSVITNNTIAGISVAGTGAFNNVIYNNYFDNDNNVNTGTGANIWNVTNRTGPNIFGGMFIGGNYWNNYGGHHTRQDGFGDDPHMLDANNTDFLPLVITGEPNMWIRNAGYDIEVGDTWEYLVTCRNGSNMDVNCTNLSWTSSNETVGTVFWSADDAAIITGHAIGVTNITVSGCENLIDVILQNVTGRVCDCGDVDCDDSITMNDVLQTYYRVIDPSYPLGCEWCADVDDDGFITMIDVIEIYYKVIDPSYLLNCSD